MKTIFAMLLSLVAGAVNAQTKVTESATVTSQEHLELQFDFADEIAIQTWDRQEVLVEVSVSINEGMYDHIFTLEKEMTSKRITISMDKDMWNKIDRTENNCNWRSELHYKVFLPASLSIRANTINGNFAIEPRQGEVFLKTISGDIDITVPGQSGLDFKAKTISGEIYSDLDIEYPEGREGLRQVVGMNVKGRINSGGAPMELETISGNIYLRRG